MFSVGLEGGPSALEGNSGLQGPFVVPGWSAANGLAQFPSAKGGEKEEYHTCQILTLAEKSWFNKQNGQTLTGALAYVPFVLQAAYFEGSLDEKQIVVHRGKGYRLLLKAG